MSADAFGELSGSYVIFTYQNEHLVLTFFTADLCRWQQKLAKNLSWTFNCPGFLSYLCIH